MRIITIVPMRTTAKETGYHRICREDVILNPSTPVSRWYRKEKTMVESIYQDALIVYAAGLDLSNGRYNPFMMELETESTH